MSREAYIWIAFCVFAFLMGMRLKKHFGRSQKNEPAPVADKKNQRPEISGQPPPSPSPPPTRRNREKTIRVFTMMMMVVVALLILGMIPTLLRDVQRESGVDPTTLFLRLLIFLLALLVLFYAYIKLARQRKKRRGDKDGDLKK